MKKRHEGTAKFKESSRSEVVGDMFRISFSLFGASKKLIGLKRFSGKIFDTLQYVAFERQSLNFGSKKQVINLYKKPTLVHSQI